MKSDRTSSVETMLRAARTRLILERPFIGALVVHLDLEASPGCGSVATDARRLRFDPQYIATLTLAETQFVLAHAALHCALGHFVRRAHRVKHRWDAACDYAVNGLLADDGLRPPAGALLDARYRGLSAEEIYPLIPSDRRESTLDAHAFEVDPGTGGGTGSRADMPTREAQGDGVDASQGFSADGDGWSDAASTARTSAGAVPEPIGGAPGMEPLAQAWRMRLAGAAQQARLAGRLGAGWQRVLGALIEPRLNWRSLLARHLASAARDDYSFQRPSRRGGDALLPSLASNTTEVFVALDTSGSIGERELSEFAAEIDALKGQLRARVTLVACDEALAPEGPWCFQPWEPIVLPPAVRGGAGTDFRPVFDWIDAEGHRPAVLVYFTDAEGDFPDTPPPYPVVWLVKGAAAVPWGERIPLG